MLFTFIYSCLVLDFIFFYGHDREVLINGGTLNFNWTNHAILRTIIILHQNFFILLLKLACP